MSEVVFLTGVEDKLAFACRLLRKKYREGARTAVFGTPSQLAKLDLALWEEPAQDFVPHVRLAAGAPTPGDAVLTTVWLLETPDASLRCDNAVNLGIEDVERLVAHARVAEIIARDDGDRMDGQQRWKRYKALGHTLLHRPQDGPKT